MKLKPSDLAKQRSTRLSWSKTRSSQRKNWSLIRTLAMGARMPAVMGSRFWKWQIWRNRCQHRPSRTMCQTLGFLRLSAVASSRFTTWLVESRSWTNQSQNALHGAKIRQSQDLLTGKFLERVHLVQSNPSKRISLTLTDWARVNCLTVLKGRQSSSYRSLCLQKERVRPEATCHQLGAAQDAHHTWWLQFTNYWSQEIWWHQGDPRC